MVVPETRKSSLTQADLDYYGRVMCMPLALLINFSLFQYLITIYFRRRHEPHCMVLLASGFLAFVCLIPYAHDDNFVVNDLNDVSEILSVATFLVQITMIGRDINKKMRIRALRYMTRASEALIFISLAVSVKDLIILALPHGALDVLKPLSNILEEVALWFIFCFRFYFIAMSKGTKALVATKKSEIAMYLLFVTHEYPFQILNAATDLDWEEQQALWHRLTMALCLFNTVKEKLRSTTSKVTTRGASHGQSTADVSRKSFAAKEAGPKAPTLANLTKRVVTLGPSLGAVAPAKQ